MSQEEVASAGLTRQTVVKLEQYTSLAQERTLRDLRKVFEDIGIEFLFADRKGIGLRNLAQADSLGLQGTPAYLVGHFKVTQALTYEGFKGAVAEARAQAGQ